jgi:hypothetical protein
VDEAGHLYVADNQNNRGIPPIRVTHPERDCDRDGNSNGHANTHSHRSVDRHRDRNAIANPNRDPIAGSRTYLGQPQKLDLERRSGRDCIRQYQDQQHWQRNSDRRVTSPKHRPILTELGGGNGIPIGPGGTHNVTIVFSPAKKGSTSDLILITSNDPKHKEIKIKIKATAK